VLTDQRFGDILSQKTMSSPIRLLTSALRHEPALRHEFAVVGQLLELRLYGEAVIDGWLGFVRRLVRRRGDRGPFTLFVSQLSGVLGFDGR
jgi:hypothetical protein